MINKWLCINGKCLNLKRANKIFYDHRNGFVDYVLFVDFDDELIKICVGNEKKIKRRFKAVKEFLVSSDEIMELKD